MANKQVLSLFNKNRNLCEINKEYPSLKQSSIPRHLCTDSKPSKTSEHVSIDKLSNRVTTEHQDKDSNKHSKTVKEQTEMIDLFQFKQEEEINNKYRYQLRNHHHHHDDEEEERDNLNSF